MLHIGVVRSATTVLRVNVLLCVEGAGEDATGRVVACSHC